MASTDQFYVLLFVFSHFKQVLKELFSCPCACAVNWFKSTFDVLGLLVISVRAFRGGRFTHLNSLRYRDKASL